MGRSSLYSRWPASAPSLFYVDAEHHPQRTALKVEKTLRDAAQKSAQVHRRGRDPRLCGTLGPSDRRDVGVNTERRVRVPGVTAAARANRAIRSWVICQLQRIGIRSAELREQSAKSTGSGTPGSETGEQATLDALREIALEHKVVLAQRQQIRAIRSVRSRRQTE